MCSVGFGIAPFSVQGGDILSPINYVFLLIPCYNFNRLINESEEASMAYYLGLVP